MIEDARRTRENAQEEQLRSWAQQEKFSLAKARLYSDFIKRNNKVPLVELVRQIGVSFARRGISQPLLLDAGCGDGSNTIMLAEALPGARIVGVDISQEAIGYAKEVHASPNITYEVGDATKDDSRKYDLIFTSNVLEHVSDPRGLVTALARSLKDGGVVVHSCPTRAYWSLWRFPYLSLRIAIHRILGSRLGPQFQLVGGRFMGGTEELYHGVASGQLRSSMRGNGLHLLKFWIIVFLPPRFFLRYVPRWAFRFLLQLFELSSVLFRRVGLQRLHEFQVLVAAKGPVEPDLKTKLTLPSNTRDVTLAFVLLPFLLCTTIILLLVSWLAHVWVLVRCLARGFRRVLDRRRPVQTEGA